MENEYQPKCSDALQLGSKDRYVTIIVIIIVRFQMCKFTELKQKVKINAGMARGQDLRRQCSKTREGNSKSNRRFIHL